MFEERKTVEEVEEGNKLSPKFDKSGLIPVVTTDIKSENKGKEISFFNCDMSKSL